MLPSKRGWAIDHGMLTKWAEGAASAMTRRRGSETKPLRMTLPFRDRELEAAIEAKTVALRYQPQIDPMSGQVIGVEALARWSGAEGGEALFARAAKARLDQRLSRLVAQQAIAHAARWTGALANLDLSINLLPADLEHDNYPTWLLDVLKCHDFAPKRLTVEIVESDLLSDTNCVAARLARLRDVGVRVAIDDFGTGYASLAWLTGLPIDTLKIDRALITDIVGRDRDRIVVKALLHLARDLNVKTVVEGVESAAQLELLAGWGCDLYQGFLGSEPLDAIELERFVRTANLATL